MQRRRPTLQHIAIDLLVRGKYQPRQHFDQEKLQELADSIKTTGGLLQPIVVRPLANNHYEIVAGERRWRAAQLAGIGEVSCLVTNYSDEQTLQASIVENTSRTDLNPIEEAQAYQRLIDEFGYLHEEVAASVGKSRVGITNTLRLLKLESRVQKMLVDGRISEGHGKILAGLEPALQVELADRCAQKGWNVRKLEMEAKKAQQTDKPAGGKFSDANLQRLETALSEHVGNRVQVEYEERGGGFMRIRFNNVDELEGHFDRIGFEFDS
jgi:ParB family transcriptional regulator, chromosome partitioning protein